MKKVGVFLVILILFSVSVSAFGLNDILKLFSSSGPIIINTQANPIKVYPGQSLQNLVAFEDACGIESATAYFPYEGGYDKVEMILSAGDSKKGTYSASWVVHDTLNMKWYKTKVVLVSVCGGETIAYVDWQDPTQDHPLNQVRPGISQDAASTPYKFWSNNSQLGETPLISLSNIDSARATTFNISDYGINPGMACLSLGQPGYSYPQTGVMGWVNGSSWSATQDIYGVVGLANLTTSAGVGVFGHGEHYGVYGIGNDGSPNGNANYGVYGEVTSNLLSDAAVAGVVSNNNPFAGYFSGGRGVYVNGNISSTDTLTTTNGFKQHSCAWTGFAALITCPTGKYVAGVDCDGSGNCRVNCCYP